MCPVCGFPIGKRRCAGRTSRSHATFAAGRGTIQFRLPCDGWRDYWTAYCRVPGDNQWHRYRLFFNRDFKSRSGGGDTPIDFDRLRNELFLFSRAEFNLSGEVAVHDFEIKNIVLN